MRSRHVRQIGASRADTPEAGQQHHKGAQAVCQHGVLAGLVADNPARQVEYLRSGSDGYYTWADDGVAQFEACHPVDSRGSR